MPIDTLPPFTVSPEYAKAQAKALAPKAGVASSEFWLQVAALIVPMIAQAATDTQNVILVAVSQVAAALYTVARTWLKSKNAPQTYTIVAAAPTPLVTP